MIFSSDEKAIASFECAAVDINKLYFAEIFGNEIFCYDMESGEVTLLCTIHEEDEWGKRLFFSMVIYEGDIFVFPFSATGIYRINIQNRNYIRLDWPEEREISHKEYKVWAKFMDAYLCGDVIYVMPATFPGILEVQCSSNKIMVYDRWIKNIPLEFSNSEVSFFRKTLFRDNKIYAPFCKGNMVMIFDVEKKECVAKEVGTKECRFSGICYNEENFWLSPRDKGPIVKWNEFENTWQEYDSFPESYIAASTSGIEIWENNVMVFPQMSNMILMIDCSDGIMKEWNPKYRGENVVWYKKQDDILLICMGKTAKLIVMDKRGIKETKIFLPEELQKYHKKIVSATYRKLKSGTAKTDPLIENYVGALEEYLEYVKNSD